MLATLPTDIQDRVLELFCDPANFGMTKDQAIDQAEAEYLAASQVVIVDILDGLVVAVDAARSKLEDDIEAARVRGNTQAVKTAQRWLRSLEDGYNWLLNQETVTYDRATGELTIASVSDAGAVWHANGHCECPAGRFSGICYHRSAARLVRRALEVSVIETKPTISKEQILSEMMECFNEV